MNSIKMLTCVALTTLSIQAQGLGDLIRTADRAVADQKLEGVWLLEIQRPGPPTQPPGLALVTFHAGGTLHGSLDNPNFTTAHGIWLRMGGRRFLQTHYILSFNENRVLSSVQKARIVWELNQDGSELQGIQELVIMAPNGTIITTISGLRVTGTRLPLERAEDLPER